MKQITPEKRKTAPFIAFILSMLLAGLGQIMNGQIKKGFIILISCISINIVTYLIQFQYADIVNIFLYLYAAYDAYKLSKTLKGGKSVSEFKFF